MICLLCLQPYSLHTTAGCPQKWTCGHCGKRLVQACEGHDCIVAWGIPTVTYQPTTHVICTKMIYNLSSSVIAPGHVMRFMP